MSDRLELTLDALGDPMRRRIVERLRASGPSPVGELASALPIGRPAVSKHLKVLEGAGLVVHRSAGTRNLYALAPQGFAALQRWLAGLGDDARPWLAGLGDDARPTGDVADGTVHGSSGRPVFR